jgi:serine/threonine protein kinase
MSLKGQVVDGYTIGNRLGGGAMGQVYEALPDASDPGNAVAIKFLSEDLLGDEEFVARFEREMRLMQSLEHPNIVPLIGYGSGVDFLYIAMKFIDGMSLGRLMQQRRFSPIATWNIVKPLCEALEYGHSEGVVHRDVKPGNIMLEQHESGPHLYLMDYGMGKKPGMDITLTEKGVSVGTPEYMSPEAAMGHRVDHRGDIYSLAVVVYELLLGVLPFDLHEPHLTALAHVRDDPPPLTVQNPDFPHSLEKVIMTSLAKSPSERHQSAMEFAQAYYDAAAGLSEDEQRTQYTLT